VVTLPWILVGASDGPRQSALPSGDAIGRRVHARYEGRMMSRMVVMELVDRDGRTRRRVTRSFRKDYASERRTVIFFLAPTNIKGTAWLTYDYHEAGRADDQWMYLPAVRAVRRIPASERGASFLGSDFTHEDMRTEAQLSLSDYRHEAVGEESVDGRRCYVVEAIPISRQVARELGYGRVRQWIDADTWMPRRGVYWDVTGNPLKEVTVQDVRQVQGIWTAHRFEASTHRTGHRTILQVSDVEYPESLDDVYFTERGLRRGL